MGNRVIDGMWNALAESLYTWLYDHPPLLWMVAHPLGTGGIILVLIFLFWGLLKAIAHFIEQAWILILKFPFRALRWLLDKSSRAFPVNSSTASSFPMEMDTTPQVRLTQILARLEELRSEQDQLLEEIKSLLNS